MNLVTYLQDESELPLLSQLKVREVLIAPSSFSRFGTIDQLRAVELAKAAKNAGIRSVLVWDLLMTEDHFFPIASNILALLSAFSAVRVYDPGAFYYLLENSSIPLQLLLELSGHNLASLKAWESFAQHRIEKIIPSYEIDQETLATFCQQLTTPIEVFGLGRLPLSYTPRKLLSPLFQKNEIYPLSVKAQTKEVSQPDLTVEQNDHGTFTFYGRDFSLVDFTKQLDTMGVRDFQVDLRHLDKQVQCCILSEMSESLLDISSFDSEKFRGLYPFPSFRGFFIRNKSDSVFSKLKNAKRSRQYGVVLAEVVDVLKGRYMGAMVRHFDGLKIGQQVMVRTPEGKEKILTLHQLFDAAYHPIEMAPKDHLVYLPHLGGVSVKTLLFQLPNQTD